MSEEKGSLNVRRMVGAILLAIGGVSALIEINSVSGSAMFGIVRYYQEFMYFFMAWAIGLAIWYFVTLKNPTNRKAELIVKIIFYITVGLNSIMALTSNVSDAGIFGLVLIVVYSAACPWGKLGYKKHPYAQAKNQKNK